MASGLDVTARRLVAVSWSMPPALFPRSIQVARLFKGLHLSGWRSTVVTIDDGSRDPEPSDESLRELYAPFYDTDAVPPRTSKPGFQAKRLKRQLGALSDIDVNWAVDAAAAARRAVERDGAQVLVTFAQPWRDHLVGLAAGGPRLPWVAHFSDPWVDSLYYRDSKGMDRDRDVRCEAAIIRHAHRVVFTSQHTVDLVMRKYPAAWRSKARVVEHAGDADLLPAVDALSRRRANGHRPLRLSHVGTLLAERRTLDDLLTALAKLDARIGIRGRVELEVVGAGSGTDETNRQVAAVGLQSVTTLRPHMKYLESLSVMRDSDVLVLVDAPARVNVFLPSKLADYVVANRPVLAITPADGASADLLRDSGFPVVPPGDVDGIAAAIEQLLHRHESGAPPLAAPEALARRCSLRAVSAAFINVLEEAISDSAKTRRWS